MINNRERVRIALAHHEPDKVPYHVRFTVCLTRLGKTAAISPPRHTHDIPTDAKPENVAAMLEVLMSQ